MQGEGKLKWLGHVNDQRLLSRLWSNAAVYFHGHSVGGTNPALLQALGSGGPGDRTRHPLPIVRRSVTRANWSRTTPTSCGALPFADRRESDRARLLIVWGSS